MIKHVGFDKDGTLIDSLGAYTKEWGKIIYADFGIDRRQAEEKFRKTAGQPTVLQLSKVLEKNGIELSENQIFQKANEIAMLLGERANAKPFPEVQGALKKLKNQGYKIFVSSGQQEKIVKKDLERTGLTKYIDYFAGVRPNEPNFRKGEPHFEAVAKYFDIPFEKFVSESVFVGDSPEDIRVSNISSITSIGRVGTFSKEILLRAGAKFVVIDLNGIFTILDVNC